MNQILHSKPWITDTDVLAVTEVLRSGMLAQGEITKKFERTFSSWIGAYDGVATGRGAAALVLALSALAVGDGDEVVFPTYVCTSVLESVLKTGAPPVLCDVGPNWVVTSENMADCITSNTKALIVPHMYGIFADVHSFQKFGIPIIEDCAQAIDYKDSRKIIGDIAIFSFHPTKCLTTGEGGMAVSANPGLVDRMRSIRNGTMNTKMSPLFSPMSDIAASLGLSQLSRYHDVLDRRKEFADKYILAFSKIIPYSIQPNAYKKSMFFRFPIRIKGGLDFYEEPFVQKNICVRRGVDSLLHRLMNIPDEKFNMAVTLFQTTVLFPIYPAMTTEEHARCIGSATEIFLMHQNYSIPD